MNTSERYSSHIIVFFHGRAQSPTTKMTETDDIDLSDLDLDLDLDMDLDTTWMDTAENCLVDYTPFYKKDVTRLTIVRAYINLSGEVIRVSSTEDALDAPNTLTVRHLCALAGADRVWKKYLYIVTVDEDAVEDLGELDELEDDDNFFRDVTNAIQDVVIDRTIAHFHDVNTLLLLIKEVPMEQRSAKQESAKQESAASVLEIELGSAKPLSRKNRHHKTVSFGGAKTRRLH